MKAGIYLVKHKFSETKSLLALTGTEPFIRINNALGLNSFAEGIVEKDFDLIDDILDNPSNYIFTELSNEVCTPVVPKNDKITVNEKDYRRFTKSEFILDNGDLNQIETIAEIVAVYHIDWDNAREIFDNIINVRYQEEKWEKLQKKKKESLSMTENQTCQEN